MALTANHNGFFGRHRWLVWAAGIAVAVLLLASFMSRDEVIPVRAATVERSTIRSVISTNGKVEPLQSFEAHAPVGTTVKKLLVKEGRSRKEGTTSGATGRRRGQQPGSPSVGPGAGRAGRSERGADAAAIAKKF